MCLSQDEREENKQGAAEGSSVVDRLSTRPARVEPEPVTAPPHVPHPAPVGSQPTIFAQCAEPELVIAPSHVSHAAPVGSQPTVFSQRVEPEFERVVAPFHVSHHAPVGSQPTASAPPLKPSVSQEMSQMSLNDNDHAYTEYDFDGPGYTMEYDNDVDMELSVTPGIDIPNPTTPPPGPSKRPYPMASPTRNKSPPAKKANRRITSYRSKYDIPTMPPADSDDSLEIIPATQTSDSSDEIECTQILIPATSQPAATQVPAKARIAPPREIKFSSPNPAPIFKSLKGKQPQGVDVQKSKQSDTSITFPAGHRQPSQLAQLPRSRPRSSDAGPSGTSSTVSSHSASIASPPTSQLAQLPRSRPRSSDAGPSGTSSTVSSRSASTAPPPTSQSVLDRSANDFIMKPVAKPRNMR